MAQTKVKDGLLNFPDRDDFIQLPSGTTAQRPSSPEQGYSRYNTTDKKLEFWNGTIWQQLPGVVAPIITSLSYPGDDLAADPVGGQTITINGSDFAPLASVSIGGTQASVVTFVSATQITFEAPAKAAGDYNVVVTNVDGGNATSVDGMSYNGVPSWTTAAGNLGTFPAGSTIPTITLVATEPDSGTISYSVTTGALPTGLTLTGADIDGSVPTPSGETTYNFSVTASDDENQESTERAFNIVVYLQVTNTVSEVDPFGDSSGVALYKFDGNLNDEGGNYDLSVSDGTTTANYTSGVFGSSMGITGPENGLGYVSGITSYYAFSFWGNVSNFDDDDDSVFAYNFRRQNYSMPMTRTNFDSNIQLGNDMTLPLNTWVFVCITINPVNSSLVDVYYDGVFKKSVSAGGSDAFFNVSGIGLSDSASSTRNKIDQLRIFNRALTPLEVQSLYQERVVVCGGQAETVDILGDNSCIALYPLDGNANDLSGNYSGTPIGTISYGVGEFDLGAATTDLDSSNYIDLNIQLALPQSSDLWSVSTWFKAETGSNTLFNIIGSNATITDAFNFAIQYNESTDKIIVPNWNFGGSPITPSYTSNATITDGWNHISLVKTGVNSFSLYINDNFDGSFTTNSSGAFTSNSNLALGIYYLGLGGGASSYNDQVRIFNKALSSSEVTTLYNETACTKAACSGTTNTLDILGDSSCIAAYPLDGSPLDLSGNYNGVQTNVTYPVGNFDLAGSFNGSSSYISTSYIVPASTPASISSWFNTSSTGNYRTLFSDAPSNGAAVNTRMQIYFTPTNTFDVIIGNNSGYWIGSSNSIASYIDGNWHNLIATYNGTDVKVYIDGSLFQSFTSTISFGTAGNQSLVLGKAGLNNVNYWNGSIDQVRIFNKALSAGEVTTLYNETACN